MNGAEARLLALVPELSSEAASVNTLACRADLAHQIVRQYLVAWVRQGVVDMVWIGNADRNVRRYYRSDQEASMTDTPSLADRILCLRIGLGAPGMTISEIAAALRVRPTAVSATLLGMIELGQIARRGTGKRGDPYRHTACVLLSVDDEPDAPDPDLPDGYTDAPEVVAAKMAAEKPGDTVGGTVRVSYESVTKDRGIEAPPERPPAEDPADYAEAEIPTDLQDMLAVWVDEVAPALLDRGVIPLAVALSLVAANLRTRADESEHEAELLRAAATLCQRLLAEELEA